MLRHACGFRLANDGHDTRAIQEWLGHRNVQHTTRYTELTTKRFKDFWQREGHRQVDAGEDKEAPSLIGATASCGSLDARDLGPDREGLRADGSVLGGREVIAVEMEEVVDLIMGREEPLRLAG